MALLDKFDAIDADELVDFLIERKHLLPLSVKQRLADCFSDKSAQTKTPTPPPPPPPPKAPAKALSVVVPNPVVKDFDLKHEVMQQMEAVRALRERATDPLGPPISIKETKEALSATTSLLTLLTKINGEVYNQDRIRLLQVATIEVLRELSPVLQAKFVNLLEERLKK